MRKREKEKTKEEEKRSGVLLWSLVFSYDHVKRFTILHTISLATLFNLECLV